MSAYCRMIFTFTALSSFFAVGCKKEGNSSETSTSNLTNTAQGPSIVANKEGMKKYIEEARSLARGMDLVIEESAYKKRVEAVHDAYSRIPDPPSGNKTYVAYTKAARFIYGNFLLGGQCLSYATKYLKINNKDKSNEMIKEYRDMRIKQKELLNELESAIN